jgi:mono/diheme cytochrome c family protein
MKRPKLSGGIIAMVLISGVVAPRTVRAEGAATYSRDIAPILYQNCLECHRPGEAAPVAFTSYGEVRPWAKKIREVVVKGTMPPWHADPSVGQWKNERRLSREEIGLITKWVDGGAPEGNPADLPAKPEFVEGWRMGEPDQVFQMLKPEVLAPEVGDEYRYVMIPTGFTEDRWIKAAEVRPGNLEVVHHVIVFVASQQAIMSGQIESGFSGSLGGYAPGTQPLIAEEGRGFLIPAKSIFVLQMHYHKPKGRSATDQTRIGVKFADHVVEKQVKFDFVGDFGFAIPPHEPEHIVEASKVMEQDVRIQTLIPHMHYRGKDMRVWAELPDGRIERLISIPQYDFNWQTFYEMQEPFFAPAGTRLVARATFDNSPRNPFNPNPNETVRWGLPTTAEMMFAFYIYTEEQQHLQVTDPGGAKPEISRR